MRISYRMCSMYSEKVNRVNNSNRRSSRSHTIRCIQQGSLQRYGNNGTYLRHYIMYFCHSVFHFNQMWYALKNMPSILWMIEKWLNIITLKEKLHQNHLDTTLLFQAMFRDPNSTNKVYQILNNLGAYILKTCTTIHKFYGDPMAPAHVIMDDVAYRTEKKGNNGEIRPHQILLTAAKTWDIDIVSFAVVESFTAKTWNQQRSQRIISNPPPQFAALLMQSVVGVYFYSSMIQKKIDLFPRAILQTLQFLHRLRIVLTPFKIAREFGNVEDIEYVEKMVATVRGIVLTDTMNSNDSVNGKSVLNAVFYAVCIEGSHNSRDGLYGQNGITFGRLAVLGDALLDMFVVWNICRSIGYDVFVPRIGDKGWNEKWAKNMSHERHSWARDELLAGRMIETALYEYMTWLDEAKMNSIQALAQGIVNRYLCGRCDEWTGSCKCKRKHSTKGPIADIDDSKSDTSVTTEATLLIDMNKERQSPMGDHKCINGKDKEAVKKVLGSAFEALLGAIFVGSNYAMYGPNPSSELLDVVPCIQFLICFHGNRSALKNMMRSYTDKHFDVIIGSTSFMESGQNGMHQIEEQKEPMEAIGNLQNNDSKYAVDINNCPHCGESELSFHRSYIRKHDYGPSWKELVYQLLGYRWRDGNDQMMELLDRMNNVHDIIDNVHEYQCSSCQYFIDFLYRSYRKYSTKQQSTFFSSEQITTSCLGPIDHHSNEDRNWKVDSAGRTCDHCQGGMRSYCSEPKRDRGRFNEKEETLFCERCQLYLHKHRVWTMKLKSARSLK